MSAPTMASHGSSVISDGSIVILQKFSYLRTHTLRMEKQPNVQMGQDTIDLTNIIGKPWETTFKMTPIPGRKRAWTLEETEQEVDFEEVFLGAEEEEEDEGAVVRKDNRDLLDENTSQKLSKEDIERLRDEGKGGEEIIGQLIQNSETFQKKTKFSQAKFLKKKAKKYAEFVCVRRPSVRLLMHIYYKKDPVKMMNLRMDTLSRMLNMADVRAGGRYMVYETGCQGILVASALERLGSHGSLVHIFETGNPQTQSLNAMNFGKDALDNLKTLNMYHLRALEKGEDILEVHARQVAPTEGSGDAKEAPMETKEASEEMKEAPMETKEVPMETKDASEETKEAPMETKSEPKPRVPYRQRLREESVASYELLRSDGGMDGLLIACRQHPTNLLLSLIKYLAPSAPFSVFSPYKEPLLETYMAVKDTKRAVMVTLSETWLRNVQVLPDRSHPEVNMSGGGGYVLSGIYVDDSSEGLPVYENNKSNNGGAKQGRNKRFKGRR